MTNRNRLFATVVLLAGTFSACEKEIEYEGEAGESLLVINQLIDKDSTFSIEIERSVFFLENNTTDTHISDATVTLTDLSNGSFETLSSGINGIYDFSMIATEGHQYEVTASKSDYPTASAKTVIPPTVSLISVDTSTYINPEYQENYMRATLKWNDLSGKNYYILTVSTEQLGGFGEERISMTSTDLSIINGDDIDGISSGSMFALDDDFFDGSQKELRIEFPAPSTTFNEGVHFRLYHCTEDTYRYLVSAERDVLSGEGGAFSEPVKVHTNILEGYGIFSGYSSENHFVTF
jgi:hypothetical protein